MSRVTSIQYNFHVECTEELRFQCPWSMITSDPKVFRRKVKQILATPYLSVRGLNLREDRHDGTDQVKESHG